MPIDQTHPQYQAWAGLWSKCRDAAQGQDRIHQRAQVYLPPLSGQSRAEYGAYLSRAFFYNAAGRTVDGLSGLIFRKAPNWEVPDAMEEFIGDVSAGGLHIQGFAEGLVEDLLQVGRAGILVDYSTGSSEGLSAREAQSQGRRVIWTRYAAEDIIDWRTASVDNATVLSQVRLREMVSEPDPEDEFNSIDIEQIRVLELAWDVEDSDSEPAGPFYRQRIYRRGAQSGGWELYHHFIPLMMGAAIGFIPFVFAGPRDTTAEVDKPPLLDLVNANLSHYTLMADYRHGLHFTGLPTPVVTGHNHDPAEGDLKIGSTTAWVFSESDAKASFLEFKGSGLSAMKAELEAQEARMAILGARVLAPEKRTAEAAQTAAIHRAGETSLLASLAGSASLALTKALEITRDWGGYGSGEAMINLNTDYLVSSLDADQLKALGQSLQDGSISYETFIHNLIQGEIMPPSRTAREERKLIEQAGEQSGAGQSAA